MEIHIRRWLFPISACALGWMCGFLVYSLLAWKIQLVIPVAQYQQPSHFIRYHQGGYVIRHAVVRMVKPADITQPVDAERIPPRNNMVIEPNRSYYL